MTHVAYMVATQPITYPCALASRSQLQIHYSCQDEFHFDTNPYKNKCHFYLV